MFYILNGVNLTSIICFCSLHVFAPVSICIYIFAGFSLSVVVFLPLFPASPLCVSLRYLMASLYVSSCSLLSVRPLPLFILSSSLCGFRTLATIPEERGEVIKGWGEGIKTMKRVKMRYSPYLLNSPMRV